jgi:DNA-binding YbaB/EbfC family protein
MKARLPKGFGGGPTNMQGMLKKAQQMQENMMKAQEEVEAQEFEVAAGGGAVNIVINGKKEILSIRLSPEVVDPEDIEMLQDLITAGVNEAIKTAEAAMSDAMGQYTDGMNLPGLF